MLCKAYVSDKLNDKNMISKLTGTLINNRLWIPTKNSGLNVAIIGSVESFKRFISENLDKEDNFINIQNLDDVRGNDFIGYEIAEYIKNAYELIDNIQLRIKK